MLVTSLDKEYSISIQGEDVTPENFSKMSQIINLVQNLGGKVK
jgi:acyl carrier protein